MPSACASAEVRVRHNVRAGGLFKAAALCAALLATAAAVSGDGLAAAREAYAAGRFVESAELAEALGTSDGQEVAVGHFERALELAGDSKLVRIRYARRLPKLDRKGGRERARAFLSEAAAFPVADFYDGLVHEDVLRELAALQ